LTFPEIEAENEVFDGALLNEFAKNDPTRKRFGGDDDRSRAGILELAAGRRGLDSRIDPGQDPSAVQGLNQVEVRCSTRDRVEIRNVKLSDAKHLNNRLCEPERVAAVAENPVNRKVIVTFPRASVECNPPANVDDWHDWAASVERFFERFMRIFIHEWVTGGGLAGKNLPPSLAAEGGAMRKALVREFSRVEGVRVVSTLDDRFPCEDGLAEIVSVGEGEEERVFSSLVADSDFTLVVAPETDDILATRAEMIEHVGGRSLGSSPAAIRLTADKFRFAEHLDAFRIATPPTRKFNVSDGLPPGTRFPAIVKPIDGAGSSQTFLLKELEEFNEITLMNEAMIVQEYVETQPLSASFFVGADGSRVCLGVGLQDICCDGNSICYRGGALFVPWIRALDDPLEAVRSVQGLRGWVGVDFMSATKEGWWPVLEVNPRVTTSLVGLLSYYKPGAIATEWLREARGGTFQRPETIRSRGLSFLSDGTILDD